MADRRAGGSASRNQAVIVGAPDRLGATVELDATGDGKGIMMTAEDTARALMSMDDPDRRRSVSGGDFTVLGELELTREEQRLLVHAARGEADDDVEGFGAFAPPYVPLGPVVTLMGAIRYVEDGMAENTPVRQEFDQWTAKIGAQGTW